MGGRGEAKLTASLPRRATSKKEKRSAERPARRRAPGPRASPPNWMQPWFGDFWSRRGRYRYHIFPFLPSLPVLLALEARPLSCPPPSPLFLVVAWRCWMTATLGAERSSSKRGSSRQFRSLTTRLDPANPAAFPRDHAFIRFNKQTKHSFRQTIPTSNDPYPTTVFPPFSSLSPTSDIERRAGSGD